MKCFFKIFIFIISTCLTLHAQSVLQEIKFSRLNSKHGLSQNTVVCVIQDKKGVLWFGTADGLNKYDGYEFKIYKSEVGNPNSLSSSYISCLYESKSGHIWAGTLNGGLNRFDPETEEFVRYVHDKNNPASISGNNVKAIYEDSDGKIWVAVYGGGLNYFDTKTGQFKHIKHVNTNRYVNPQFMISLLNDKDKGLWVGTTVGLFYLDKKLQKFTKYFYVGDANQPLSIVTGFKTGINQMTRDKKNPDILWLSTHSSGVARFNVRTEKIETQFIHDPANPYSLSNNAAWSFCEDSDGTYWVGTQKGLHRFDYATQKFTRFRHDVQNPKTLGGDNIQHIFQDRAGTIWVCTYDGGISSFTPHLNNFVHYWSFAPFHFFLHFTCSL